MCRNAGWLVRVPSIRTCSLVLNALLLIFLLFREGQHWLIRFQSETEAPGWARYAGAMQAIADYGNGVRRLYRPIQSSEAVQKAKFTGEIEHGAQVWTWIYHEQLGEAARQSALAFTDGYNARMRNFIDDPQSYSSNASAATQPAD